MASVRVMSYNILHGGRGREALLLEVMRHAQPDILLLQEVAGPDVVALLSRSLELSHFFLAVGNRPRHNLALLSRYPIRYSASFRPRPVWRALLEAVVEVTPAFSLTLFGVHLFAGPGALPEAMRMQELFRLITRLTQPRTPHCLVAGDFNAIAPGDAVNIAGYPTLLRWLFRLQGGRFTRDVIATMLATGFTDCFRALHPDEPGFTLPPPVPNSRLDYIFANPSLATHLCTCTVLAAPPAVLVASDHYPLLAEFEV